jgi:DNA-binding HxlR family transcriptional regulator
MECKNTKPNVLSATCPSREVLDLIADKWTVLVIYALDGKVKRYSKIRNV